MGSSHPPSDIDPAALENAKNLWGHFTKFTTVGVIATIAILALMAVFLL
jgi:hypothetical protein